MTDSASIISARNRHNVLVRHHGADDPQTREAAGDLAVARIARLIHETPLTDEQRTRLALLFATATA
jgi:hypothetical protein